MKIKVMLAIGNVILLAGTALADGGVITKSAANDDGGVITFMLNLFHAVTGGVIT